jgi:hypothetical protein
MKKINQFCFVKIREYFEEVYEELFKDRNPLVKLLMVLLTPIVLVDFFVESNLEKIKESEKKSRILLILVIATLVLFMLYCLLSIGYAIGLEIVDLKTYPQVNKFSVGCTEEIGFNEELISNWRLPKGSYYEITRALNKFSEGEYLQHEASEKKLIFFQNSKNIFNPELFWVIMVDLKTETVWTDSEAGLDVLEIGITDKEKFLLKNYGEVITADGFTITNVNNYLIVH